MKFKVIYGIESQEKESITAPTIGDVITDTVLKAILGFGDNVRALIHGVEQPTSAIVPDGGEVLVETRANEKRAALRH